MSNMGYMSGRGSVSPSSRYIISVIWTRVPGVRTQERGCRHFYYQQYQHSHCLVHVSSKPDRRIEDEVMFTFFFALYFEFEMGWDGMWSHRVNRCFSWDQFWHFQVGFIFCVLCSTYNRSVCFLFRMQTARILVILIAENMIFQSALDFKKIRFNRRPLFPHNTHI